MAAPLLQLSGISLTFGGTPLLREAEFRVLPGERMCLVGRNGSGKSTLLKIAAGLIEPDAGDRFIQPGATLRYLPQEPDFGGHDTTLAYVTAGLGPADDPHRARLLLEQLGLNGDDNPASLSGGEARRAAIARVLAPDPVILLLDEPTNHLDLATIEWLEQELAGRRCTLVLISHDRRLLQNLSRSTVWIDRGQTRALDMGFARFEAWRDETLAQEELDQHKLGRKIEAELHWMRYGVTARRKRNMRRVGELQALRTARREHRRAPGKVSLQATEGDASGALVIEARGVAKAWGERRIVHDFSTRIARRDRIGIVGPNGSGKTTLLRLLTGTLTPDAGTVKLGANLQVATLEQNRDSLDGDTSLADALTGGGSDSVVIGGQSKHVIGYMRDFLFAPEQARTPLRRLSGGERGRVALARALAQPSNVLVLDEPTNDLDLETLDALEEMLANYEGTVLLISHDRDFLDRVVEAVIVPEGDGRWVEYAGGYSDMLAQRGRGFAPGGSAAEGRERARAKDEAAPKATAPARTAKRRLSYNEQHALKTLPDQLAALEQQAATLRERLADPTLYARDRDAFTAASEQLASIEAEIEAAEHRWLELELLREEIEAAR